MDTFIKQNGFAAHGRHRTTTGRICGVTSKDIQAHLADKIPELRNVSQTFVRSLLKAPHKARRSASNYYGLVDARVPCNRNTLRRGHKDLHHLFSRVRLRREMATMYKSRVAVFSCDDMNKIKVGTKAVSRYHRIGKYFAQGDEPNFLDHDFPIPGYHLVASGYMKLEEKANDGGSDKDDVGEDDLGRMHFVTPHSGPSHLVLRACAFHKSSIQGHCNDLIPILQSEVEQGKSAIFLIVDNGPDWNLASIKNFIMYGRMWRDLCLDLLCDFLSYRLLSFQ